MRGAIEVGQTSKQRSDTREQLQTISPVSSTDWRDVTYQLGDLLTTDLYKWLFV